MSRNAERLASHNATTETTHNATPETTPASTEQSLTFKVPTSFVELPSEGKFYSAEHALCNQNVVEIKNMTTREEEILNSQSLIQRGLAVDRLVESILVDKSIEASSLLLGDKNAILTAARIDAYGENYDVTITCPVCSEPNETVIDLSSLKRKNPESMENIEINNKGNVVLELPRTGAVVELRFLTTKDEGIINKFTKKNKKLGLEKMITLQYKQMIVSVNGSESILDISKFIGSMPAYDSRFLRKKYQEIVPDLDLGFNFACRLCGEEQSLEVPITVGFFWPK